MARKRVKSSGGDADGHLALERNCRNCPNGGRKSRGGSLQSLVSSVAGDSWRFSFRFPFIRSFIFFSFSASGRTFEQCHCHIEDFYFWGFL